MRWRGASAMTISTEATARTSSRLVLADVYDQAPVEGPLTVDLVAGTLTGLGTDTLVSVEGSHGTPAADVMIGNDLDNGFILLIDGDDTVDAAGGNDLVDGGDGADDLDGGPGVDTLGNLDSSEGMTIDLNTSTTSHGDALANFEDVLGSSFDDVIIGTSGPNNIEGAEGADEISGLAGDDVIFGGIDGFDDGSTDSADGGDGTDECKSENEVNCEADPPDAPLASPISSKGILVAWAHGKLVA